MSNVLILGASGEVARYAIDLFLKNTDALNRRGLFVAISSQPSAFSQI